MELNIETVSRMTRESYVFHVHQAFGPKGTEALTSLLDGVKQIYGHCPPDQLRHPLTIFSAVEISAVDPVLAEKYEVKILQDAKEVARHVLDNTFASGCLVEVLKDNTFCIALATDASLEFDELKATCVIYRYESRKERLLASDFDDVIRRLSPALASNFAEPTFSRLEDALKQYDNVAADTGCKVLQDIWEGTVSGPRLVLANKPESIMRNSLVQFLQTLLGLKANVRPEQNVDETKPVDIRIDWFGSDASALIEIKWLGRSKAAPRSEAGAKYTDYGPSRAQKGAGQLCDYLDRDRHHTRAIRPVGYLVVYDARRAKVKGPSDLLDRKDAFWFERKDIQYNPKYEDIREDFAEPVRFFLRPRESNLLNSA